jgi:hypothetical protein
MAPLKPILGVMPPEKFKLIIAELPTRRAHQPLWQRSYRKLRVFTPVAVLLAAEEVVGTWASGRPCRRHPETRERVLKARRQNELSLIRTRMVRRQSDAAIYQPHGETISRP